MTMLEHQLHVIAIVKNKSLFFSQSQGPVHLPIVASVLQADTFFIYVSVHMCAYVLKG